MDKVVINRKLMDPTARTNVLVTKASQKGRGVKAITNVTEKQTRLLRILRASIM